MAKHLLTSGGSSAHLKLQDFLDGWFNMNLMTLLTTTKICYRHTPKHTPMLQTKRDF